MKVTLVLAVLVGVAFAEPVPGAAPTYGWIQRYSIPLAERIRIAEESYDPSRIFNGYAARLGQFPYQVGVLTEMAGVTGQGVCGGSLVTNSRVLTGAQCHNDGYVQAWRFTLVLGSVTLFSGGTRVQSTDIVVHHDWNPIFARNDIAIIRLPWNVLSSDTIRPIGLPTGTQLTETFVGETATASGFGQYGEGNSVTTNQVLSYTSVNIISNGECSPFFPLLITATNVCASTAGGGSTCRGDSGGPVTITRNNQPIQIGIASFNHLEGCESGRPAGFTRVSSFIDFINSNL